MPLPRGFSRTYDYRLSPAPEARWRTRCATIYDFTVPRDGEMVEFSVTGSGFLYNMVRIMVGTLLTGRYGQAPCTAEGIREIVLSGDRARAGGRVPASRTVSGQGVL